MAPKPHVSAAIVQLRRWISVAAVLLCLCLAAQLLIFGFTHYTDVRWTTIKQDPKDRPLTVIERGAKADSKADAKAGPTAADDEPHTEGPVRVSAAEARAKSVREAAQGGTAAAHLNEDVNRVLTSTDRVMRVSTELATTVGVVSAVSLVLLTGLGVVIAGGGTIPGVEKAVTACVWSGVLATLCLPLRDVLQSLPFPGIFSGYDGMVAASDAARSGFRGEGGVLALYVAMPAAALAAAAMVRVWFNDGVERGVIYTSVSEIDEAMDKEMASISARGVQSGMPRAMGALHRAMGDTPAMREEPPPIRMAAGAESMTPVPVGTGRPSRREIDPEEFKRPI